MNVNQYTISISSQSQALKEFLDEEEIQHFFQSLQDHGNIIILLESMNYGILTIGVGSPYGFVEFMNNDRNPPYLVATEKITEKDDDGFIEFDSEGTLTPIPIDKCLPFDRVVEIVVFFIRQKKLLTTVQWVEV